MKVEMTGHLFWYCPSAREVWEFLKLVIPIGLNHCQVSFKDLLWKMFIADNKEGTDMAARFISGAWVIWFNRNKMRHEGKRKEGKD